MREYLNGILTNNDIKDLFSITTKRELKNRKYFINNDILYYNNYQFVLAPVYRKHIIKFYHDSYHNIHRKVKATLDKIQRNFH